MKSVATTCKTFTVKRSVNGILPVTTVHAGIIQRSLTHCDDAENTTLINLYYHSETQSGHSLIEAQPM